jgi:diacylglycerol kinase (ATP)
LGAPPRDRQAWTLAARARSFRDAFAGVQAMFATEPHAWIHLAATLAVVALAAALRLSLADWCWLLLAIGLVWTAEAFNTALEALADAVTLDHDSRIGRAKDAAAGGVLLAAVVAAAIGFLVLGPPLWRWLTDGV